MEEGQEKQYTIGGIKLIMPPITLGKLEQIQKLIPIEQIEKATNAGIWMKLISDNMTKVFAIILIDEKGNKKDPEFFENIMPNDPAIEEVVTDFFTQCSPTAFYLKNLRALSNSLIFSVKEKSGEEPK
jgi:hypothetical protein